MGKRDRSGNIVTNHNGLKNLYINTYVHRLRNRPIKDDFEEIKEHKDNLFELRMKLIFMFLKTLFIKLSLRF